MIAALLALHVVAAAAAVLLARRHGRRVFYVAAVAPAVTLGWLTANLGALGRPTVERYAWLPDLGLELTFRVDALSAVMLAIVAGIGVLVLVYAASYVEEGDAVTTRRLAGGLAVFAAAMAGLVTVDDLLSMYVFWELTSVASYVLIATKDTASEGRDAAQQALLTTGAGGLAMLAGFVLLGQAAGTLRISEILAAPPVGPEATAGFLLVLAGVFTKSAQVPFHGWLPAAMAAPTPASTYLHSATMVKAGVYLAARLAPAAVVATAAWRPIVVTVGLITLLHAAVLALRAHDLKRVLAYGTISQLGLMTALLGAGIPELILPGLAVLVAHALYKASLFMVVGAIDHATGTRDIRRLPVLWHRRGLVIVGALAAVSMAGLPPLLGYLAKEAALEELLHAATGPVVVAAFVAGAALTVAYSGRLLLGAYGGPRWFGGRDIVTRDHRPATALVAVPGLLAVASAVAGVVPRLVNDGLLAATTATDPLAAPAYGLQLWHGLTPTLGLTALAVAAGAAVVAVPRPLERLARVRVLPSAERAFHGIVATTVRVASRITAIVQHGSLPVYLAVIILTAIALPLGGALTTGGLPTGIELETTHLQVVTATAVIVAAIGVAVTRQRLPAVLLLGAVGLGMAGLFILHGAPDLALTQLTVEILALLFFVIVLSRLPDRFRLARGRLGNSARILIAVLAGATVSALTVLASGVTHPAPVSEEHIVRALPEAGGRNVVNTILVDFRALDTLGEITVLTVVAFGVASLLAVGVPSTDRRPTRPALDITTGSTVLSMGVRAVYPLALIFSVYLLLAGHDAPGGGFVGGLAAGAALVLRYIDGGPSAVRSALPVSPGWLLGLGLSTALVTGGGGLVWGGALLEAASFTVDLPLIGELKLGSYTLFDFGVYLVVIGFVLGILRTLGEHHAAPEGDASRRGAGEPEAVPS